MRWRIKRCHLSVKKEVRRKQLFLDRIVAEEEMENAFE